MVEAGVVKMTGRRSRRASELSSEFVDTVSSPASPTLGKSSRV